MYCNDHLRLDCRSCIPGLRVFSILPFYTLHAAHDDYHILAAHHMSSLRARPSEFLVRLVTILPPDACRTLAFSDLDGGMSDGNERRWVPDLVLVETSCG